MRYFFVSFSHETRFFFFSRRTVFGRFGIKREDGAAPNLLGVESGLEQNHGLEKVMVLYIHEVSEADFEEIGRAHV